MKKLSISIPNYNRIKKLERLLREIATQIMNDHLDDLVQICISDDYSKEDPTELINSMKQEYSRIDIRYCRKGKNEGMDCNFLSSVLLADAEYCWIVGNDDLPAKDGIKIVLDILQENESIDFIVTPFDIYDEMDNYRSTLWPLNLDKNTLINTNNVEQKDRLFASMQHNSAIFGFLSNVVFKREHWITQKNAFSDKTNTLFIQMYMNISKLMKGAFYYYDNQKIIINYADDETNLSVERICKILFGLDDVVEYFFDGKEKAHFKRILTDAYISGLVWELPKDNAYKKKVVEVESEKNELYKRYYISINDCSSILKNEKVVIYGAGDYGKKTYNKLLQKGIEVIGVADSDIQKRGKAFETMKIISIEDMVHLHEKYEPYVIVANHFHLCDMVKVLQSYSIKKIGIMS